MKKKCSRCGKPAQSDLCFKCKPTTLKKSSFKPKLASQRHQKEKEVQTINPMWEFFLRIWKQRIHKSEISGEWLGTVPLSTMFHHILTKSKYPQAKFDEENVILLHPQEHGNVHLNENRYELINEKRKLLKIKYNIL